jgi:hypothetical protein
MAPEPTIIIDFGCVGNVIGDNLLLCSILS